MMEVADLTELQSKVNAFVAGTDEGAEVPEDLRRGFAALRDLPGIGSGKDDGAINWMKQSRGAPAFTGSLDDYVRSMRAAR